MKRAWDYFLDYGWVWVGVFVLVNLMQGKDSVIYQYFHSNFWGYS